MRVVQAAFHDSQGGAPRRAIDVTEDCVGVRLDPNFIANVPRLGGEHLEELKVRYGAFAATFLLMDDHQCVAQPVFSDVHLLTIGAERTLDSSTAPRDLCRLVRRGPRPSPMSLHSRRAGDCANGRWFSESSRVPFVPIGGERKREVRSDLLFTDAGRLRLTN